MALKLKGAFETLSEGKDLGEWNCFVFLKSDGALLIVRYGDTTEHVLWGKTAKGVPCIEYNVPLSADTVCRAVGATPAGPGKFTCDNFEMAKQAAKLLAVELPELSDRPINFTVKGENLTVEADRQGKEAPKGWAIASRKLRRHFGVDAVGA